MWLPNGGKEAVATDGKIMLDGHSVYGVYIVGNGFTSNPGAGYRNNSTSGVPTGDQPEGIYTVVGGKHFDAWCCFDYGNAETNNTDNGPGTMEAVYFGSSTQWGRGSGNGPWVMADLEDGLYAGQTFDAPASNVSMNFDFVTGMVKGNSGNSWAIRGGNAQSGKLQNLFDGQRPSGGYNPMRKEGAIILGIGGDNSSTGEGTFFEGCITSGYPSSATDDAVQANIVAVGYGSTTTAISNHGVQGRHLASLRYDPSASMAHVEYATETSAQVDLRVVDLRGAEVSRLVEGEVSVGNHEAIWDAKHARSGLYLLVMEIDGRQVWTGNVIVGR